MSEDTAFRRVAASRLVRRFPSLLDAIERGELHLTGLLLLGPHLTEANLVEVLARAKHRTKKEILGVVRQLNPIPDVPSRVEPLGPPAKSTVRWNPRWEDFVGAMCPVRELLPGERPSDWLVGAQEVSADVEGCTDVSVAERGVTIPAPERVELPQGSVRSAERSDVSAASARDADRNELLQGSVRVAEGNDLLQGSVRTAERSDVSVGSARVAERNEVSVGSVDGKPISELSDSTLPAKPSVSALSGPQRFKVQFTASEEYVALLEEAQGLLAHALPSRDLAEVHLRAMRALVVELKKRKYATHTRPADFSNKPKETERKRETDTRGDSTAAKALDGSEIGSERGGIHSTLSSNAFPTSPSERGRYVPAAVRRAVFERDGARCAYVDDRGERCRETARLEFHHHQPFALGGTHDATNLSLRCAQHNALAAEQDFGRDLAIAKRHELPHSTWRTESHFTLPDDG
jgi:hypothetical protein